MIAVGFLTAVPMLSFWPVWDEGRAYRVIIGLLRLRDDASPTQLQDLRSGTLAVRSVRLKLRGVPRWRASGHADADAWLASSSSADLRSPGLTGALEPSAQSVATCVISCPRGCGFVMQLRFLPRVIPGRRLRWRCMTCRASWWWSTWICRRCLLAVNSCACAQSSNAIVSVCEVDATMSTEPGVTVEHTPLRSSSSSSRPSHLVHGHAGMGDVEMSVSEPNLGGDAAEVESRLVHMTPPAPPVNSSARDAPLLRRLRCPANCGFAIDLFHAVDVHTGGNWVCRTCRLRRPGVAWTCSMCGRTALACTCPPQPAAPGDGHLPRFACPARCGFVICAGAVAPGPAGGRPEWRCVLCHAARRSGAWLCIWCCQPSAVCRCADRGPCSHAAPALSQEAGPSRLKRSRLTLDAWLARPEHPEAHGVLQPPSVSLAADGRYELPMGCGRSTGSGSQ